MRLSSTLQELLEHSARRHPGKIAIDDPGHGTITYRELALLSDLLRDRLWQVGVRPGDRVGMYLRKSIDAVASIFGILKTGAAYVPVDPSGPPWRGAYILNDCAVRAVVIERRYEEGFRTEAAKLGDVPPLLILDETHGPLPLQSALAAGPPAPATETVISAPASLAYILYTSGSTGKPKGVMLTQRSAISFVDWCSETFAPTAEDRFSSHAPLHFDLSILDLFVTVKHGATVVLIGEEAGKEPIGLAPLIAEKGITIWYSTPSILSLLAQYGKLERYNYARVRTILFAGEVFPVPHLRALKALLPTPRYFNLYGPTETNVCTSFEIPERIPEGRTEPFPIGRTCSHLSSKVVDTDWNEVKPGEEGELCISGPGVMEGYWNRSDLTARAFLADPSGLRWYKTGDIVKEEPDRNYIFLGRRDRMVKRRGYRVELDEIEAGLAGHPAIKEVAVIALPDEQMGIQIRAFLGTHEGQRPSQVELKGFCVERLPRYMIPDYFAFVECLPRTSTGKTDYQRLKERG